MTDSQHHFARTILGVLAVFALIGFLPAAFAQVGASDRGWTVQPGASTLRFQSVKNVSVAESSGFATFSGQIDPQGEVELRVLPDSVDTRACRLQCEPYPAAVK